MTASPPSFRHARAVLAAALLTAAFGAQALAISGANLPDQVALAGQPLQLNGAGVRYKAVFKVYAAGLYLPRKTSSAEEAASTQTAKRLTLVMLREIDSAELGKMFARGMEDNVDRVAASRVMPGVIRMSQVFTDYKKLREGQSIHMDWVPGVGTQLTINGEKVGEPFREPEFFQALIRIWLGSKPADWKLKDALLGKPDS